MRRLSDAEIRRRVQESDRRSRRRREQPPAVGWSPELWAFVIAGSLIFWGLLIAWLAGAFS